MKGGFVKENYNRYIGISGSILLWIIANTSVSQCQIIPDSTLPNNTRVTSSGSGWTIDQGTRIGNNLFHSFVDFSVPTGNNAVFDNTTDIQNIINRVTGRNISNIDGLIQANGNANFFLINPNGIVFEANAQLNIGGSFIASTAESIKFADGSEFSSTNPQSPPLLTINTPIGLQFGANPGQIINRYQANSFLPLPNSNHVGLEVQPGQTLALVGGDVIFDGGNVRAFQGRIELGSVANSGLVSLNPTATGLVLGYDGIQNFGNILLSGGAAVNASGLGGGAIQIRGGQVSLTEGAKLVAETFGNFNGGGIDIQANQFQMDNRAFISTSTFGAGAGGNLNIRASQINMTGTAPGEVAGQLLTGTFNPFNLSNGLYSLSVGSGAAGDITIDADQLIVKNGVSILTTAINGPGGDLNLNISNLAEISDRSLFITGTAGSGNSGNFNITANRLRVLNGTSLTTTAAPTSSGRGGDFKISANSVELLGTPPAAAVPGGLFTATLGSGDAGDLTVKTGELIIADGAQISASSAGAGRGGHLTVNADSIDLKGASPDGKFLSGLFTSSSLLTVQGKRGTAPAGDLTINTQRLLVRDGAQISAATGSEGAAGDLTINASESVEVRGVGVNIDPSVEKVSFGVVGDGIIPSAIDANTSGAGKAGNLIIKTGELIVRDGAEVGVRGTGAGAAGDLQVSANLIRVYNQGAISAATVAGSQGNIKLQADGIILQDNSRITTNTGNSDGGNIEIDAIALVAKDNSDITANAQKGRGGRVRVTADGIFGIVFRPKLTPESDITATSDLGPEFSGIVQIIIQGLDPSRGLVPLPINLTNSSAQITTGCAADRGNSFTVTGRGGLPEDPTQSLLGTSIWQDLRPLPESGADGESGENGIIPVSETLPSPIIEATGWEVNGKGEIDLVADARYSDGNWYNRDRCHAGISDNW
ncbi:MAG TPA: filamentous hemagglutinin [Cyanobacteria bacterium UBA11159]|nr:filamentous hemagglutinin [Cyanobacteria bacterium UBA11367]HBE56680.1 filamentous hemagglutinin [Cyanobacteria bacterium UBA11366]HBK65109.1 filamentous hemagglutinin [Cyanobacteria bacterium UBA11166]HBR73858.1 filamentous hemagglutinin [Cyanobacteria bacterium UBA11159]HBS67685.1 filamentous hemagglutinin [Cyanobacteria bacterium UBA11153]HCA97981.1 filamentous hemagglutinin [Cyanobacteria bacterium UBA9226]